MKWFENTYKKAQMKGLVKFAIVDAATKMKVWIPVEALFVEGTTNLLSQRVLYKDNGFFAQISESQEVTTLPNRVKHIIWDFDMVSGLYQTMVGLPRSQLAVLQTAAQPARSLRLWHYRPEHANWQVIQEMASKGFVRGLELSKEDQARSVLFSCDLPVKTPRRSHRFRKKSTQLKDFVSTVFSSSASATASMKIEVPRTWTEMMASPHRIHYDPETHVSFRQTKAKQLNISDLKIREYVKKR
ncbi:uncharacterized protein PITG_03638 [Phytophthora infestans T30-4]|uniref:GAG-pre-integrase domain-containing protein n=1 Tax=Phytophthora infestans (strain T30-4) TaxID=403677 RepID=D0MY48_PHYIT|nr:uncharacterized protein PITG_03638 [Phytophthora infestans T30-4]EEY66096.1 conserved hypothetical protein [Phytophthora infestans T30-4]|eukprot:XP_002906695.1 conserved hypothetical protein [Phytophthora infestans T30-4]